MAEAVLERLKNIDTAVLTQVVRQDQSSPSFEITEWSIRRLSDQGVISPDGLWLFSGQGYDSQGPRSWSVVLKIIHRQKQEPAPSDLWYWKRELLFAQSRLTARLPGLVKAPIFHHTEETPEGAWIWMEFVQDRQPSAWTLDHYSFAARQLGHWNGAYLTGTPLPDENWLARQHYRSWLLWMNLEKDWQFSLNQKHISDDIRKEYEQLWNERETFYNVLEGLPQVFSHFDSQRRNLFIRHGKDQADELVLVDWAQCGLGTLGAELTNLVGGSGMLLEWPPSGLSELDAVVFQSYVQGLHEVGWSGNVDVARLGYVAWLAVYFGCIFPGWTAWWCAFENRAFALQICGLAEEELFWKLRPVLNYTLDCADEARLLMKKLGLS